MLAASALIGATGFVGGNLQRQARFDEHYNSKNISEIRGKTFDLLVCAGVTAVKWWANKNAGEDRVRIDSLLADLASVKARNVIVLSTVDVYPTVADTDETSPCHNLPNHAYGTNRLYFEDAMRELFSDAMVVRIGGVFGPGLKKNVIFDLINDNCLDAINPASSFQYYNVTNLWRDLMLAQNAGLKLVNFVTQPIGTATIIERFFPGKVVGASPAPEAHYDIRTVHSGVLGGPDGYLASSATVLAELGRFIETR